MTHQTAEKSKQANIEAMGPDLGAQFFRAVATSGAGSHPLGRIYGAVRERVDLLNQSAPVFFNMLQSELSDIIVLHLTRLTDKPEMFGQKNLTVRNLPGFINEEAKRKEIEKLAETAFEAIKSCRAAQSNDCAQRLEPSSQRQESSSARCADEEPLRRECRRETRKRAAFQAFCQSHRWTAP